jgi:membrane-bound lytic murein transglycosylase D
MKSSFLFIIATQFFNEKRKNHETMKRTIILLLLLTAGTVTQAALQKDTLGPNAPKELNLTADNPEMQAIDKILVASYLNHFCFSTDQSLLNAYGYAPEHVPTFSQEVMAERLKAIDQETPFDLVYNNTVQGFIDLYAVRRRDITTKVLGMSQMYFPMFEEALARHNIPLEMKYLAIVESALNPTAISPAGAGGLWQFMVSTGKMYGLNVTSYEDDRFDPYKSTDAACKYLRFLYDTFGDWQLALAAYNSGPGNVNKAIRRSGGKKDFWAIKSFLPKETQGYVPAFIAVNYVMNYASEHNIYPKQPLTTYFETDTVAVTQRVDFNALSKVVSMPVSDISFMNGAYKLKEIPENGRKHYLILPVSKVGLFISNEALVYSESEEKRENPEPVFVAARTETPSSSDNKVAKTMWIEDWETHKVKRGESLGSISDKYNVSLGQLKKWNKIKGSKITQGQKLRIQTKVKKTVYVNEDQEGVADKASENNNEKADSTSSNKHEEQAEVVKPKEEKSTPKKAVEPQFKYYTVQPGDTLWKIANKHNGVSIEQIKNLNKGLRENKLTVGQKIKIKQIG